MQMFKYTFEIKKIVVLKFNVETMIQSVWF